MTREQIAELKELAEKATPYTPETLFIVRTIEGGYAVDAKQPHDVGYIAAANPQAVLELIADYERLEKENLELRKVNYDFDICALTDPQSLSAAYFVGLVVEARKIQKMFDKFIAENNRLNAEANWLADKLAGNLKIQGQRDGLRDPAGGYQSYWRNAAREAVEEGNAG